MSSLASSPLAAIPRRLCSRRWAKRSGNGGGTRRWRPLFQCRIRGRARYSTRSPVGWQGRAGLVTRQSGRRSQDPPVHLHRFEGEQFGIAFASALALRRRLFRTSPSAESTSTSARRLPSSHRIAKRRSRCWISSTVSQPTASCCGIDFGGSLGIRYRDEVPPAIADYAAMLLDSAPPGNAAVRTRPATRRRRGVMLTRSYRRAVPTVISSLSMRQ